MNMRVVDLFCGAGGFSQGMQEAGHHVVGAIDFEGAALAVHAANVKAICSRIVLVRHDRVKLGRVSKRRLRQADITDILSIAPDIAELNPDIIIGGPPCQPWSKSGKRRGDDDSRAKLTEAFGIMVAATRPQYFVMENVPQIRGSKVFRRMKDLVRRVGYGLTEMVVNAGDYGTAQKRARFLCVGALNEADGWFHDYMSEIKLTRPFSVADILPDFGVELHRKRSKWVATGKQRVAKRTIKNVASDADGGYRLRAADIRLLERSGDSFKAYWRYPGGRSSGGIRRTDEPAPSIIKSSGGGVGKKYRPVQGDAINLRLLPVPTLDQLSQIAGFPAGWDWTIKSEKNALPSDSQGKSLTPIQMLANAVAPPLAASIGRALSSHAAKHIPVVMRTDWKVPGAYTEWLVRTRIVEESVIPHHEAVLREAKNYVRGHNLPDTDAEIRAFDKVAAVAHGELDERHKCSLRRALCNFADWEAYSKSLPSSSMLKKVIKMRPHLLKYPKALRLELAAAEIDSETYNHSKERRKEWQQQIIAFFEAGDPRPYGTSIAETEDYNFRDEEEDSGALPIMKIGSRSKSPPEKSA